MNKTFLITWVTHNSRISERMIEYNIKKDDGYWMDEISEQIVTEAILQVVQKDDLKILAYNICGDHVHLIVVCEEEDLSGMVRKLKSQSARIHNIERNISESSYLSKGASTLVNKSPYNKVGFPPCHKQRGQKKNSLWAQKYHSKELPDEDALSKAVEYIRFNRIKHKLPPNHETHELIQKMICEYNDSLF